MHFMTVQTGPVDALKCKYIRSTLPQDTPLNTAAWTTCTWTTYTWTTASPTAALSARLAGCTPWPAGKCARAVAVGPRLVCELKREL